MNEKTAETDKIDWYQEAKSYWDQGIYRSPGIITADQIRIMSIINDDFCSRATNEFSIYDKGTIEKETTESERDWRKNCGKYWYEQNILSYIPVTGKELVKIVDGINKLLVSRGTSFLYGPFVNTTMMAGCGYAEIYTTPEVRKEGVGVYTTKKQTTAGGTHMTLEEALKMYENM